MAARSLQFTAPYTVDHVEERVGPPEPTEVRVETVASGISPGTELLLYRDQLPDDLAIDDTIDTFDGTFSYPVEYGYAAVGRVTAVGDAVDQSWDGRLVFGFEPHRTAFCAEPDALVRLPGSCSPATGTMLPTVETAANLVLDSQPRLGERVAVFGAGVVGLTTTRLLSSFPLAELVVVEPQQPRREMALEFGADRVAHPDQLGLDDLDLAVELTGNPEALDDAVGAVGFDGRIVVGSWYGTKRAPIDLGGRFHRDRISIVSSQVSTIAPELRGRWDHDRRMNHTLDWLDRIELDRLITHRIPFFEAARAYELLDSDQPTLQVVLTYTDEQTQ